MHPEAWFTLQRRGNGVATAQTLRRHLAFEGLHRGNALLFNSIEVVMAVSLYRSSFAH